MPAMIGTLGMVVNLDFSDVLRRLLKKMVHPVGRGEDEKEKKREGSGKTQTALRQRHFFPRR